MTKTKTNFTELISSTLRMLHAVPQTIIPDKKSDTTNVNDYMNGYMELLQAGIVIDPQIMKLPFSEFKAVKELAKQLFGINKDKLNASFYHSFNDVKDRSELQIRIEQLFNYMTVYTDQGYAPDPDAIFTTNNEPADLISVEKELVVISVMDNDTIKAKLTDLLSGSALSESMLTDCLSVMDNLGIEIAEDKIANKQFLLKLWTRQWINHGTGSVPKSDDMALRLILSVLTSGVYTQLVKKDQDEMVMIKLHTENDSVVNKLFHAYADNNADHIASIYNRYKKFLLLLKHHVDMSGKHLINYIGHRSKTIKHLHALVNPVNAVLQFSTNVYLDELEKTKDTEKALSEFVKRLKIKLDGVNNYKLIKIINAMRNYDGKNRYYIIRNGKSFLTVNQNSKELAKGLSKVIALMAYHTLLARDNKQLENKIIYLPKNIDYAVPTSTKTLIGNIPYMSEFHIKSKYLLVGLSWSDKVDIDLHAEDLEGNDIGWNADYDGGGYTYSGDMTYPAKNGYAAEYIVLNKDQVKTPAVFTENWYNGINYNDSNWYDEENTLSVSVAHMDMFISGKQVTAEPSDYLNHNQEDFGQMVSKIDDSTVFVKGITNNNTNALSKNLLIAIPEEDGWRVIITGMNFGNITVPQVDVQQALLSALTDQADHCLRFSEYLSDLCIKTDNGSYIVTDEADLKNAQEEELQKQKDDPDYQPKQVVDLSLSKIDQTTLINLIANQKE